jgi:hypothetical protein
VVQAEAEWVDMAVVAVLVVFTKVDSKVASCLVVFSHPSNANVIEAAFPLIVPTLHVQRQMIDAMLQRAAPRATSRDLMRDYLNEADWNVDNAFRQYLADEANVERDNATAAMNTIAAVKGNQEGTAGGDNGNVSKSSSLSSSLSSIPSDGIAWRRIQDA